MIVYDQASGAEAGAVKELRNIRLLNDALVRGARFDLGLGGPGRYVGILTIEGPRGRLSAQSSFEGSPSFRSTLVDLAGCLAECAMSLGVGASIIRGRHRETIVEYP